MASIAAINLYTDCIPIKDIRPNLKNINVVFIVLEVGAATVTKENRVVRTFKVADPTACINVSVWDEPGNLLIPGDIVRLTKGYAAIWRQCLTLYSGKNGDIQKIGDFCLNFNEHLNMSEPNPNLVPMNQKNQTTINNGNTSNNGNINSTLSLSDVPTTTSVVLNFTSVGPTVGIGITSTAKTTGSIRNSGNEHGKTTLPKSNARSGRNNQTRSNVKNERR